MQYGFSLHICVAFFFKKMEWSTMHTSTLRPGCAKNRSTALLSDEVCDATGAANCSAAQFKKEFSKMKRQTSIHVASFLYLPKHAAATGGFTAYCLDLQQFNL
jgi:hypothetical protein